jgi:hypothetical protein
MSVQTILEERRYTEGVAVVMPAYGEEGNLEATVEDFLDTLSANDVEHRIVVVDDGSPDGTGDVLRRLVERHPGVVIGVHHDQNRGYGAAVRTGIDAALDSTDLRWLLLTDSDGQFRAADVLTFLDVQDHERADAVIGYRRERADSPMRRVNAALWTLASTLLLRTRSRDVDCAFKLIDRRLLMDAKLEGEAAAISPELLARVGTDRARIVEHPVGHYPRQYGEQTGASPKVILRSLTSLLQVYAGLVRDEHRWPRVRRLVHPKDPVLALLTIAASAVSVLAYLHYRAQGTSLAYIDAVSHVLIAKRVLSSPTAGVAQIGGVWPPLPHLLALPLVWMRGAYESGFAATIVSMIAFVITARYLYKLTRAITGSRVAGVAGAALFVTNANALYLQSTPMTETLLLACIAAAVFHLYEWSQTGRYSQLGATSVAILLATLTRYEGWVLCAVAAVLVVFTARRLRPGYTHSESNLIFFGVVAFGGIASWLAWNGIIFGNPLNWQNGQYAKSSLWVSAGEVAVGHPIVALQTYFYAVRHDIGLLVLVLGAAGLVAHLVRNRLRIGSLAPYCLVAFAPFFVFAIYAGQRPLHVPEIDGYLYNVRFGLVMVLASSVFAGYLLHEAVGLAGRVKVDRWVVSAVLAAALVAAGFTVPGVATLTEAKSFRASASEQVNQAAADWLRTNYDGGLVLMESWGNEAVTFESRIPTANILYEGSFRLWQPALRDPANRGVRWVHLRNQPGQEDDVWRALNGTPQLLNNYDLVYRDADRLIYRYRGSGPPVPPPIDSAAAPKGTGS